MPKAALTSESQFTVSEERTLNVVIAGIFLAVFGFAIFDYRQLGIAVVLPLIPAFIYILKARNKKIYIRINKKGIYENERLLTGWEFFLNARIDQKQRLVSIQDNFVLVVEYRKAGAAGGFRRMIPLTNTQNQSEEDVLDAVKFFFRLHQSGIR